jgi:hypothetical protein
MPVCPACGNPIHFETHQGQRIPLDDHEVIQGENRFVKRPGRLVPVADTAQVMAFTDHRETCPKR